MSLARASSRPPVSFDPSKSGVHPAVSSAGGVEARQGRAKALPISADAVDRHLDHMRSPKRTAGRKRSRELVRQALTETRCLVTDFAEAIDVDERGAGKAVTGERPIDLGDLIAMARHGRGSMRTARRVWALIGAEFDRIESTFSSHE